MKNLIFLASLLMMIIFVGCDEFLAPEQINLTYNEVFWKSEKDAENAVLGCYAAYRGLMINGEMYNRADATTGIISNGHNGGSSNALWIPGDFDNVHSDTKSWGNLEGMANWNGYYKVIATVNQVITKVDEMSPSLFKGDRKEQLMGEAYFLRALIYFDIARIWGNAPLVTECIESSEQVLNDDNTLVERERSNDVEIVQQVLADCNKAIAQLDYDRMGTVTWGIRANKASANVLYAHANLWMDFLAKRDGLEAGTFVTNAVEALKNIEQGGYSYINYENASCNEIYNGQSSEAIFELNVSTLSNESYRVDHGGIQRFTCKISPSDGDAGKDRASYINWVKYSNKELLYPGYPADIRADLFWEAWDSNYEEAFSDVSAVATDRSKVTWMKKYALMSNDPSAEWDEYVAYFAEANIPVFRYRGARLLLAEAYVKNNQPDMAKVIVDEIRSRAGLEAYQGDDILTEILMQRRAELFGEGHIYFDCVRNNNWNGLQVMTPERYNAEGYYWPVSGNILISNKLIKQTVYWRGKTKW